MFGSSHPTDHDSGGALVRLPLGLAKGEMVLDGKLTGAQQGAALDALGLAKTDRDLAPLVEHVELGLKGNRIVFVVPLRDAARLIGPGEKKKKNSERSAKTGVCFVRAVGALSKGKQDEIPSRVNNDART